MVSLSFSSYMCLVLQPVIEDHCDKERDQPSRLGDIRDLVRRGVDGRGDFAGGVLIRFSRQRISADWAKSDKHSLTWQRPEALRFRPVLIEAIEQLRPGVTKRALAHRVLELDEWLDTPVVDRIAVLDA